MGSKVSCPCWVNRTGGKKRPLRKYVWIMSCSYDHHPFRNKLTTRLQNEQGPCLPLTTDLSPVLYAIWNPKLPTCLKLAQLNISLQIRGRVWRTSRHPYVPGAVSYGARGWPESVLLGAWNKWPSDWIFYCLKMHIFGKFGSILFIYFKSFEYKNVAFSHFGIFKSSIPFFSPSL